MYSTQNLQSFELDNGSIIEPLEIGYHTYGTINKQRDNVIWVCHALTANSDVLDWWPGLFGKGRLFDPKKYFIVCPNALGSCYGTTGPLSKIGDNPPLLDQFPHFTTRDMARAHEALRKELNIDTVKLLIGASLGGQQAIEWAIESSTAIQRLVLIATNAQHSPYGIAFNESQRLAIYADPTFGNGNQEGGKDGLAIARSIALLSYRSYEGYGQTQKESDNSLVDDFKAASYQRYQGQKLVKRFNAYSYVALSKAMDSHNVARGRESIENALEQVEAETLVIGISTDQLFPVAEQQILADNIPKAHYHEIRSQFGHDGFLIETEAITSILEDFVDNKLNNHKPTVFKTTIRKSELINLNNLN